MWKSYISENEGTCQVLWSDQPRGAAGTRSTGVSTGPLDTCAKPLTCCCSIFFSTTLPQTSAILVEKMENSLQLLMTGDGVKCLLLLQLKLRMSTSLRFRSLDLTFHLQKMGVVYIEKSSDPFRFQLYRGEKKQWKVPWGTRISVCNFLPEHYPNTKNKYKKVIEATRTIFCYDTWEERWCFQKVNYAYTRRYLGKCQGIIGAVLGGIT